MAYCPDCNSEIDPDVCWCGEPLEGHGAYDGHSATPMGCTCGYEKPTKLAEAIRRAGGDLPTPRRGYA